jgi:hypothetical protein
MELPLVFQKLAIALGLGLLVGLQRERTSSSIAGVRTYPLVALFGTVCALLSKDSGGWMIPAGLIALITVIVIGNLARLRAGENDPGLTSEMAMLLMFGIGAYLVFGYTVVAVVLAGTRRRVAASQAGTAWPRAPNRRQGFPRCDAVCGHRVGHFARPAGQGVRTLRSSESAQDLVDGRAD